MSYEELDKEKMSLVKRIMIWSAAIYYALIACMFFVVGMIAGFIAGGNYMDYTTGQIRKLRKK